MSYRSASYKKKIFRSSRKTRSAPSRYNSFKVKYYSEKAIIFNAILFLRTEYLENADFREDLQIGDVSIPDDGISEAGDINITRLYKIFELLREGGEILRLLGIKKIEKTHGNLYHIIAQRLTPEILMNFVKNNISKINSVRLSETDITHRNHYIDMIEYGVPDSVQV